MTNNNNSDKAHIHSIKSAQGTKTEQKTKKTRSKIKENNLRITECL